MRRHVLYAGTDLCKYHPGRKDTFTFRYRRGEWYYFWRRCPAKGWEAMFIVPVAQFWNG